MNLLRFLKENEFSRKIFGEREIKIIDRQLNGVSLTQSEKNRLSRDIRSKFKFIKECAKFKDEFNLKKGIINKKLVERAKEAILNDILYNNIKSILLFGSMVENKMTFRSDIDIAVIFDKIDLKEATKFRIRVLRELPDKVDVQVFNVLPQKIKKEILRRHRALYKK